MKKLLLIASIVLIAAAIPALGQHGGKAEPNRITFAAGRTSKVLSATLARDEEMDYVFSAKKGQKVTITNPRTSLFDVRVFSDENNVETEFEQLADILADAACGRRLQSLCPKEDGEDAVACEILDNVVYQVRRPSAFLTNLVKRNVIDRVVLPAVKVEVPPFIRVDGKSGGLHKMSELLAIAAFRRRCRLCNRVRHAR